MRRLLVLLAALVLFAGLAPAHAAPATSAAPELDPNLVDQLQDAAPDDRLIVFIHADTVELAKRAVLDAGLAPLTTWDQIGVAVGAGTPAQIRAAQTRPGVTFVEADQPIEFTMETSHIATRGAEARETFTDADGNPIDGTGTSVAVIDSGIDGTHPMFMVDGESKVKRNLKSVCPLLNPAEPYPNSSFNTLCMQDDPTNHSDTISNGGHGTHVAGTVAGVDVTTSDGRELHGAAPGATLIGLSVGQAISVYGGNQAMNWVLEHHADPCGNGDLEACPPIRVTNHSYGPPGGGEYNPNNATSKLQDLMVAEGIVVNWAAGNDGDRGAGNATNPPGQSPTPGVIMVASYNDMETGTRDGAVSSFSSRGRRGEPATYPDISAPGSNITSACGPTLPICQTGGVGPDPWYGTISGTSMASPHMAGIVAQVLQANPDLTPGEIEQLLKDTAYKFTSGGEYEPDPRASGTTSYDKGHGLVDATAAVAQALGADAPEAPAEGDGAACAPDEPQVTDERGDATEVVFDTPLPSEPALDIISGQLSSDPDTRDVTFTIEVDDLGDLPPSGSQGEYFEFSFTALGGSYYVIANRNITHGERYRLGRFGSSGLRETLNNGLTGSFDPASNLITAVLPAAAVANAVSGAPVITAGEEFSGLEITSRRDMFFLVPNADSASGACSYVVGSEHTVSEDPDPEEPGDGRPGKGKGQDKDKDKDKESNKGGKGNGRP